MYGTYHKRGNRVTVHGDRIEVEFKSSITIDIEN